MRKGEGKRKDEKDGEVIKKKKGWELTVKQADRKRWTLFPGEAITDGKGKWKGVGLEI